MCEQANLLVAVIGCGYWGKNLVRNFNHLGALGLVCDATSEGRARAVAHGAEVPIIVEKNRTQMTQICMICADLSFLY